MAVFDTPEESQRQYKRMRRYVGASVTVIDDDLAEEYFEEAQERYPNDTAKMVWHARVIAAEHIRGNAAMLGKYAQNQSTEDLTTVFKNLTTLLEEAKVERDKAQDAVDQAERVPFFMGKLTGRRGQ
jgi:mevalonate kinase